MITHKTKGIVLRTVKYGETSLIVTIFTELFGVQSYLVNGVRVSSRKGPGKANLFQHGAILDLIVYHNELKNLQRIKEFKWGHLYQHLFFDVVKNSVALFMVEILQKTLKQPEANPDLFHFVEDAFLFLDEADAATVGNYPLFFSLHLTLFSGLRISDTYSKQNNILDMQEGEFVSTRPLHPHFLEEPFSFYTSQLLKAHHPSALAEIKLNKDTRRILLNAYEGFFALHVQDFGTLKTLPVLQEVLG
jgi:DNA repair protein RecO (recombination protein O)